MQQQSLATSLCSFNKRGYRSQQFLHRITGKQLTNRGAVALFVMSIIAAVTGAIMGALLWNHLTWFNPDYIPHQRNMLSLVIICASVPVGLMIAATIMSIRTWRRTNAALDAALAERQVVYQAYQTTTQNNQLVGLDAIEKTPKGYRLSFGLKQTTAPIETASSQFQTLEQEAVNLTQHQTLPAQLDHSL